ADVGVRFVPVNAPRRENSFRESIFAGTPDVIHDLVATIFDDGFANARGDIVEDSIPTDAFPFTFTAFARALQRIKNAIGIGDLIQRRRTFGAITSAAPRILRIAFELLNLVGLFIDIGQQPARGLAAETSGRH